MDGRLANIERLLAKFCNGDSSSLAVDALQTPQTSVSISLESEGTRAHGDGHHEIDDETSIGAVGLQAESTAASKAINQKITQDTTVQHDDRLLTTLARLKRLVARTCHEAEDPSKPTTLPMHVAPSWTNVQPILMRYTCESINFPGRAFLFPVLSNSQ